MTVRLPLTGSREPSPQTELDGLPAVPVPVGDPVPAPEHRAVVWAAAAVLVGYPDAGLWDALPGIESALRDAPRAGTATDSLLRLVERLRGRPLLAAQQDYVATFDTKRRCCPYLTYYLHGDTRRRGLALWRVKAALGACGVEPAAGELPDHLAVLAELAATGDERVAMALLSEHRAGLALLRSALDGAGSPYVAVVEAIESMLPAQPDAEMVAARLAASGPPSETVGLPGRLAPFLPDRGDRGARR